MEIRELITKLRDQAEWHRVYEERITENLILEAADKLEQLQRLIDDIMGDHYVDYLEFYSNRCRELEEKLGEIDYGNKRDKSKVV